jgi:hypothetical protein
MLPSGLLARSSRYLRLWGVEAYANNNYSRFQIMVGGKNVMGNDETGEQEDESCEK